MWVYLYTNNTETELKNAYIWIPDPISIVLNKSAINLTTIWQTEQLSATIRPTVSDKTITWSSDDTTVATVSTTWLVTCVTPWTCTITATTVNWLTATCSVRQWWSPWVNTIVYYPLDIDFTDNSWNGYNLTWYNSAVIGTLNWLSCLNLTASNSYLSWLVSWLPQGWADRINMFWVNWTTIWWFPPYQYWQGSWYQWDVIYKNNSINWSQYWLDCSSGVRAVAGNWYYIAVTIRDGSQQIYINGELKWTSSVTVATNGTTLYLWHCVWDNTYLNWYLSNFIIEDRIWTGQEIADYYNQTKSLYGIS